MTTFVVGSAQQQQYVSLAQAAQTPAQEPVGPGAAASVGSLAYAMRADAVHPSGGLLHMLWGNGSDGNATLDGTNTYASLMSKSGNTYTLLRTVFLANLTVASGVTLITANMRVYVNGVLQNNGTIQNDGLAASGATANSSATNGAFPRGGPGHAGATGVGVAGSQPPNPPNCSFGGAGGAGGAGTAGAGAAGGSAQQVPSNFDLTANKPVVAFWGMSAAGAAQMYPLSPGSGGGSGAGDSTNSGGAGGQGGGILNVCARILTGAGTFTANGGGGGTPPTGNCGGGGGGGNGLVIANANDTSGWTGSLQAIGGAGGAAVGTGVAGTAGSSTNGSVVTTYLNLWL